MAWLLILGLAVSSSIDNLGVGMSYGIRKIKISHASNMMIAFICFVFSYIG
ncbi:manganese efflux pump, partial [Bacillus sp. SIMBA_154]